MFHDIDFFKKCILLIFCNPHRWGSVPYATPWVNPPRLLRQSRFVQVYVICYISLQQYLHLCCIPLAFCGWHYSIRHLHAHMHNHEYKNVISWVELLEFIKKIYMRPTLISVSDKSWIIIKYKYIPCNIWDIIILK